MGELQRAIGSGKVCCVTGEFTMLVAAGDVRCRQKVLITRSQLAIAARHTAVFGCAEPGWKRLPTSAFTEWANFHLGLEQHQFPFQSLLIVFLDIALACRFSASAKTCLPVYNL